MQSAFYKALTQRLLQWHSDNPRYLPWKEADDPYLVWISEIILQQTQVTQGIPYYRKFAADYPTVEVLASATEDEILNAWQGLGYNSRALNLRRAAQTIVNDFDGQLPNNYDELLSLSGVGPYTASAIASFAFGRRTPVIDTNVLRVMARVLGIETVISKAAARAEIARALDVMIQHADPAEFNQAIMNFGAMQCTAKRPNCAVCPFNESCVAYSVAKVDTIPVKPVKRPRKSRILHYLVLAAENGVIMRKRDPNDIWPGMYDFPISESVDEELSDSEVIDWAGTFMKVDKSTHSSIERHRETQLLTHQKITAFFYTIQPNIHRLSTIKKPFSVIEYRTLHSIAVPKIVDCYFKSNSILL